jgi:agmatine/peptidylarginine deiminase
MIFLLLSLFSISYGDVKIPVHNMSDAELKRARIHNKIELRKFRSRSTPLAIEPLRPVAEYEEAGYLIFDAIMVGKDAENIKLELIKNLPKTVTAVILIGEEFKDKEKVKKDLTAKYEKLIDKERLKFVEIKVKTGYWERDVLPVPIWMGDAKAPKFGVVDAQYFRHYEPDAEVAKHFNAIHVKHSFTYEGGNFLSDSKGNCVTVKGRSLEEDVYKKYYGCKTITYLPHSSGIGHVDEVVKFISDGVVVTDTESYRSTLEKLGYKVYMLPKLPGYRTYVNSLIVNKTVYVPLYDYEKENKEALETYKSLGFSVFGANSEDLSQEYLGSIHCSTMTYPPVKFEALVSYLHERF